MAEVLKPPLFLVTSDGGDADAFTSLEEAVAYVEAIDIINDEYRLFDSDGRRIHLKAMGRDGPVKYSGSVLTPDAWVVVDRISSDASDLELFEVLITRALAAACGGPVAEVLEGKIQQAAAVFKQL